MKEKKRILLTGGSGFIGKNILLSKLATNYEIIAPSSKELNLTNTESVDHFFETHKIDYIIHSACKPGHRNASDLSGIYWANTRMFFNLERHLDKVQKFLFLGSGAVYDMNAYKDKMPETYFGHSIPKDEHGFAKFVSEKYAENNSKIVTLRIFGIFGPYEDYAIRFISNMICKSLHDLPLTMNQDRMFDYIDVQDLPTILEIFLANENNFNAYNITPNESILLSDLAKIVLKVANKKLDIVIKKPGLGNSYSGSNKRLISEFNNISFTPIEVSIKNLYSWYEENLTLINKELLITDK